MVVHTCNEVVRSAVDTLARTGERREGDHVGLGAVQVGQVTTRVVGGALFDVAVSAECRHFVGNCTGTWLPAHCRRVVVTHEGGADIRGSAGG